MDTIDCTDIKVLLSGLVDDEVDEPTRYRAERHLADCADCRRILDEMESLNHLIALEAGDEPETDALSDDFVCAVLDRTDPSVPNSSDAARFESSVEKVELHSRNTQLGRGR